LCVLFFELSKLLPTTPAELCVFGQVLIAR
jgi:hypothetical protein